MAALSCTGLPVASSLVASHIDCTTSAGCAARDVKASTSLSREPCVGCVATSGSRITLGVGGRATGLSDVASRRPSSHRSEDKSWRRLEVVQQAAPPALSFPERNSMKNLDTGDVSGTTSHFACVTSILRG